VNEYPRPMFDLNEVETPHEHGGKQWTIPLEDGREITVIRTPTSYGGSTGLFEAALWAGDGSPDPIRTEGWLDPISVLTFIIDARGNWGLSNPDVCEAFKQDGSCIHSEHTR
jgi:hypothetical protein